MTVRSLLFVGLLCVSQSSLAVCYYQGRPYPTGARVGNHVCQADGTWRRTSRHADVPQSPLHELVNLPNAMAIARRNGAALRT